MASICIIILNIVSNVFLVIKIYELIFQSFFTIKAKEFNLTFFKKVMSVSRFMLDKCHTFIFRLPILIFISTISIWIDFLFFNETPLWLLELTGFILFFSLWMELIQSFIIRIYLGNFDEYLRFFVFSNSWKSNSSNFPIVSNMESIRHIVFFLIGFVSITILGYANIYAILNKIDVNSFKCFNGSFLDSLYFSTTTFTTVGFGDIVPVLDISKIIVTSEIFFSVGILILLILSYSMTLSREDSKIIASIDDKQPRSKDSDEKDNNKI